MLVVVTVAKMQVDSTGPYMCRTIDRYRLAGLGREPVKLVPVTANVIGAAC